jgi:hypothetical protein
MVYKLVATGVSDSRKERAVSSSHRFLPAGKAVAEGATAAAVKAKKRVLNIVFVW